MSLFQLSSVNKGFGGHGSRRVEVLRDINLTVDDGEFVAIVGYSGSGKSTLISLAAGLLSPDSGTITLDGKAVEGPTPDCALVFQNYSLLPWLSVFGNIALAVDQIFKEWPKERRREHVEHYISLVNLSAARDKRPRELSGGMRQRVSLARSLAMNPRVLLLDEPLGALDALTRATLQDELCRIWERDRKTMVLITNDVDEGILLADRIIPLSAGPEATLGPAIPIHLARPRDRKAINHEAEYKAIRKEVIHYLLHAKARGNTTIYEKLILPDIEPEDLRLPRPWLSAGRKPRRRNEVHEEEIVVNL